VISPFVSGSTHTVYARLRPNQGLCGRRTANLAAVSEPRA